MLQSEPCFSIITINKNNAIGLQKTIESVINQTCKDFEYIIIDGKSDDTSVEVIKKHESKIQFWQSEKDYGIYNAMNKGIRKANGTYCIFLNSGDYFVNENTLTEITKNFTSGVDLYFGDVRFEISKKEYAYSDTLNIMHFVDGSIPHGASAIKRNLFNRLGFYNEEYKIVSDWEFFLKAIFIHKIEYKHIPQVLTIYEENGISVKKEFNNIRLAEREKIFTELMPEYISLIDEYKKLRNFRAFWVNTICYKMHIKLIKIENLLRKKV